MHRIYLTFVIAAISGCATAPKVGMPPALIDTLVPGSSTEGQQKREQLKESAAQFDKALDVCRVKSNEYRKAINRTGYTELAVVTTGIVAGSIIVPALAAKAAAKSAIAAWGGVSGAANGYQYAANQQGLSAAQHSAVLSVMTSKIAAAMELYNSSLTDAKKAQIAVGRMILACEFPTPTEIQAAIPPSAPHAPRDGRFVAGAAGSNAGEIQITPPDEDGGANITDYITSITPTGPALSSADFRDPTKPVISVTSLAAGTKYTVIIRAQNRIGMSGGINLTVP